MIGLKNITLVKVIVILFAVIAIAAGASYARSVVSRNNLVSHDAAENFAVVDSGVNRDDVSGLHSRLEQVRGKYVYDVKFHVGDIDYQYHILAQDGTILEKHTDSGSEIKNADSNTLSNSSDSAGKKTAAEDLHIAEEGTARSEAGSTGNISQGGGDTLLNRTDESLKADSTLVSDQGKTGTPARSGKKKASAVDYIGVERAKQIALDDAGFTESEVIFSTAKFDKDDDDKDEAAEYEIEFYKDNIEYEYDIDALTGKILDFSSEIDDD